MAATLLTFARTGTLMKESYADLYDKTMDAFLQREESIPLQLGKYFREERVDSLTYKVTEWSDILNMPRMLDDTAPQPFDQPSPGYDSTLTIYTWRNGVRIEETLVKIDRSGKVQAMMQGLPASARRFVEAAMADIFNTATTTAGADGSNLIANDHYHAGGVGGTWSNIETAAAFSSTSFNTMRANMRKRKNEKGFVSPITLKKVLVPVDLESTAVQISRSDRVPETSTNAANPWKGMDYEVIDSLTSTTGFWGVGDLPQTMHGLIYGVLTPFKVSALQYPSTDYPHIVKGYELYGQVGFKATILYNMHRNAGA